MSDLINKLAAKHGLSVELVTELAAELRKPTPHDQVMHLLQQAHAGIHAARCLTDKARKINVRDPGLINVWDGLRIEAESIITNCIYIVED